MTEILPAPLRAIRCWTKDDKAIAQLAAGAVRDEKTGCLLWYAPRNSAGYGTINYRGHKWFAHRLAYAARNGPIPSGIVVCHACDNPPCVEASHLYLGTPQENLDDARRKGRMRWRATRLNPPLAAEIKRRLNDGETPAHIAREMGLVYHAVMNVKWGRAWRHVKAAEAAADPSPVK